MSDNPILLSTNDPLFEKRENWLKKKLNEALSQPFVAFSNAVSKYQIGLYFIYNDKELLYIGMTEREGQIKAVKKENGRLFVNMEDTKKEADATLNYYDNPDAPPSENEEDEPGLFD